MQEKTPSLPGLRHFRAFLAVAESGGLTAAGLRLRRSASSLAWSVGRVEERLGARLLDRGTPAAPTRAGLVVMRRSAAIRAELEGLRQLLLQSHRSTLNPRAAMLEMQTDLAHLRALIAVQDYRSVQRAASFLGLSQPAISYSIRLLETDLGLTLFSRMTNGMIATPACSALGVSARRILAELARMADDVRSLAVDAPTGLVCVGGLPYSRSAVLPDAIRHALARYAGIRLRTVEGPIETMLAGLHADSIDAVICAYPHRSLMDGLQVEVVCADPMGFFVAGSHPLAGRSDVDMALVVRHPFILPPQGSITRSMLEQFCIAQAGQHPVGRAETSSQAVIRNLLAGTDFVAFRSRREFRFSGGAADIVELKVAPAPPERQICLLRRGAVQPSGATAAFLEIVREVAGDLAAAAGVPADGQPLRK